MHILLQNEYGTNIVNEKILVCYWTLAIIILHAGNENV